MPVLITPGTEQRSRVIADRTDQALSWLHGLTGRRPEFTLYIAGRDDWDVVADVPIYGMPQSVPNKVVTSPTPGDWWQEYTDALSPHLSPDSLAELARVYGDPADFTALADLIVVHELTHLYHEIDPVTWASEFPDDWVMELFANLGMHGYLAKHEPDRLTLLSTMAKATLEAGSGIWPMQDLGLMGQSMQASTINYVWYEFMLIRFAESIWNTGGEQTLLDYQRLLGEPSLEPDEVARRLEVLDPAVASAVRRWPQMQT